MGCFPSDSLESQSCEFDETAHIKPFYGVEDMFFDYFGLKLAMFFESQLYKFDSIAHMGP